MTARRTWFTVLLCLTMTFWIATTTAATRIRLFAAVDSRTQAATGLDISQFIAAPADIRLSVVSATGPAESLLRLQDEPLWGLAILPADVLHAYADAAEQGNADAVQMLSPVRMVAPLYTTETYFIVREDSTYEAFHDIRDAKINVGPSTGTTALSVGMIYRLMFDVSIQEHNLSTLAHEDALVNLITQKGVDVVAISGDQPLKLLANMKPEARRYVRLLRFDSTHPSSQKVLEIYAPTTIRSENYRNFLQKDYPSVGTTQYLVAYRRKILDPDGSYGRFIRSWCANPNRARADNIANISALVPPLKLPTVDFGLCEQGNSKQKKGCPHENQALGLCK